MKDKKLFYLAPILIFGVVVAILLYSTKSKNQGALLYETRCANCHMENGKGLQSLIPPLVNADYLEVYRNQLACIVRKGIEGEIMVNNISYNQPMPGNEDLTDTDIANILNFVLTQWGNQYPIFSLQEVQAQLENCP
ncbi:MAG: cytochrome c [Bacteroidota bacterium]